MVDGVGVRSLLAARAEDLWTMGGDAAAALLILPTPLLPALCSLRSDDGLALVMLPCRRGVASVFGFLPLIFISCVALAERSGRCSMAARPSPAATACALPRPILRSLSFRPTLSPCAEATDDPTLSLSSSSSSYRRAASFSRCSRNCSISLGDGWTNPFSERSLYTSEKSISFSEFMDRSDAWLLLSAML
jgi:hypothetical protein